jgi:hypothetical protein
LPGSAGSDAHCLAEIGRAYVEMEPFMGSQEFLSQLRVATVGGRLSYPWVHFSSRAAKYWRRLRQIEAPAR